MGPEIVARLGKEMENGKWKNPNLARSACLVVAPQAQKNTHDLLLESIRID
jgi:hypothetical protein